MSDLWAVIIVAGVLPSVIYLSMRLSERREFNVTQQIIRSIVVGIAKDAHETLSAIAALADGLRARDARLDALSEQVRLGFEELSRRAEFNNLLLKDGLERGKETIGIVQNKIIFVSMQLDALAEQVRLLGERLSQQAMQTTEQVSNLVSGMNCVDDSIERVIKLTRKPARKPKGNKR